MAGTYSFFLFGSVTWCLDKVSRKAIHIHIFLFFFNSGMVATFWRATEQDQGTWRL